MAYRESVRSQMLKRLAQNKKWREQRWDQENLDRQSTAMHEKITKQGEKGGLLGGVAGFAGGELLKQFLMPGLITLATGGVFNPFLVKGLMAATSAIPAITTGLGAWGGAEYNIDDDVSLGESQYGYADNAYRDATDYFRDYSDAFSKSQGMKGFKYGGLLSGGLDMGKSLYSQLGKKAAEEQVGEKVISSIVEPTLAKEAWAGDEILDIVGTLAQKETLAKAPEKISNRLIENVGSGLLDAPDIPMRLDHWNQPFSFSKLFSKGMPSKQLPGKKPTQYPSNVEGIVQGLLNLNKDYGKNIQ